MPFRLPSELMLQIAGLLGGRDLCSFRLCCRGTAGLIPRTSELYRLKKIEYEFGFLSDPRLASSRLRCEQIEKYATALLQNDWHETASNDLHGQTLWCAARDGHLVYMTSDGGETVVNAWRLPRVALGVPERRTSWVMPRSLPFSLVDDCIVDPLADRIVFLSSSCAATGSR